MSKDKVTLPQIAHSEYAGASRVIHSGPCIVKAVHVATGATAGACQIFDGESLSGEQKAIIHLSAVTSYTWRPGDGTDFDRGIYIIIGSATMSATVTYIPESRKAFI